jgi:Legume lectin domain/Chitobiase/beta-hexosaminidase C-terminal domain/Fn3 associated
VIYYTIDGSVPTTSSAVYSSPISVGSGTVTIKALAQAPGDSISAAGSATYTIQSTAAATPTFSPAAGTYTSTQSVTISGTTPGAVIYYTTNGATPTTSSAVYSSAITVSASTTLEALAVAPGYAQSAAASAAYVIQSGGTSTINFAGGFPSVAGLQLNGATKVNSNNLELTDGGSYEAGSAFWTTPVNIQAFTTNFTFQLSSAVADGFTFTIQDAGTTALGNLGGGLGYGVNPNSGTTGGIANSVAVKFDIYSNSGEGSDSTGVFTDGAAPTNPAVNLTSSGVVLSSGDTISAQLVYNGTTLTLNLTDTVTNKTFSQAFTINIPTTVGASTAYVGFTGGTGGSTAIQNIKTWTFTSGTP